MTPESFSDHNDEDRSPLRYGGMAINIADISLFFAYPWPEEQELIQELSDAIAVEGAILVTYYTDKKVCVFQKVYG